VFAGCGCVISHSTIPANPGANVLHALIPHASLVLFRGTGHGLGICVACILSVDDRYTH
jgi:hypothetical protein